MTMVRISAAYLFNIGIKSNGEERYLLVKSERRNQYQPVGGCYKYFDSACGFLNSIGFIPEKKSNGVDSLSDLRLLIPKENVESFIEWYNSMIDREITFDRELNEELISSLDIEDRKYFEDIKCTFLSKGDFSCFYDEEKGIESIKPMDIISLDLTREQAMCLEKLVEEKSNQFIFATKKDIIDGVKYDKSGTSVKIGSHSKNIFVDKKKVKRK